MEFIVQQITSLNVEDVGILVPTNSHVDIIEKYLLQKDVVCEVRKRHGGADELTLDFTTTNPKIMTYHIMQFNDYFFLFVILLIFTRKVMILSKAFLCSFYKNIK